MRKRFFNFIAYSLTYPKVIKLVRRLHHFFYSRLVPRPSHTPESGAEDLISNISIWQPTNVGGKIIFARPEQGIFGDHYSDKRSFSKQKQPGTVRICYFGESAALGYLYAPKFSPSSYLEKVLNHASESKVFEVIDLSQTNEKLESMIEKIQSSVQLSPDIWIIFAGNNWSLLETPEFSPSFPSIFARERIGRLLSQTGYASLADEVAKSRLNKIGQALEKVNSTAKKFDIDTIIVIPEVNLADWESKQPIPDFPDDTINLWYKLYRKCLQFIEQGEWEKLLETGFEMWELDTGTCSTTYRLISMAHQKLGNIERAKASARAEIDSIILPYMGFLNAPQITTYDQEVLRRAAQIYGLKVVDLPKVFSTKYPNKLPGREHFLDYCHLTTEGIQLVVEELEMEIRKILDKDNSEISPISLPPPISQEAEALAQFGAAIHTAHRLVEMTSKKEILEYWCRSAYATSPKIAQTMLDFVEARVSNLPAVFTAAQQRNLQSNFRLLHSHGWKYSSNLDIEIIMAIRETLRYDFPDSEEWIINTLLKHHAVEDHSYDLVYESKYIWDPLVQVYSDLLKPYASSRRASFRAIWPQTDLILITKADKSLKGEIVARTPGSIAHNNLQIFLNSEFISNQKVSASFQKIKLNLPMESISYGVNKLSIIWPQLTRSTNCFSENIEKLSLGREADLVPIFGEIFSLKVF